MPQSKPGQTPCRQWAEAKSKLKDRILAFLCEPLVQKFLYWLLFVCLAVEEHLLQILLEE